jgi:hypothetical protein
MAEDKQKPDDEVNLDDISIEQEPSTDVQSDDAPEMKIEEKPTGNPSKLKRLLATKKGKALAIVLGLLIILGVLYAVPTTRYGILGTVIKKNIQLVVADSLTGKPVSGAMVSIDGKSAQTSEKGEVLIDSVPVGDYMVKIAKKYYKDGTQSYTVPVFGDTKKAAVNLEATGRQVEVKVTNTITKEALSKVSVVVSDTSAITDSNGVATIVLPADKTAMAGSISLSGYNDAKVSVKVTDQAGQNNFSLTPSGEIYYLSNSTGTLNVMKSNLDGTNAKVAVKGTGNETSASSVLLAARDWNYMALLSHRTNDATNQLYLLSAKTGALTLIDQSDSTIYFSLIGWSDHHFVYEVYNNNLSTWQAGRQVLKSYNAETGKLSVIDQTSAGGSSSYNYASEQITSPYIIGDKVYYGKSWSGASTTFNQSTPLNQKGAIMSINADGSQKTRIKEFALTQSDSIEARAYEPLGLYFRVATDDGDPGYYALEDGTLKGTTLNDTKFYNTPYPTYLVSPLSDKVLWQEYRDGKNALFVGDAHGNNAKTIGTLSDYATYGWFGDEYILLSKGGSELYVARSDTTLSDTNKPLKVTDYYKPRNSYPGYGYGYGGF